MDFGVYAWAISIHILSLSGIDASSILHPPSHLPQHLVRPNSNGISAPSASLKASSANSRHLYIAAYSIAGYLTTLTLISLILFWTVTSGDSSAIIEWHILPISCFISLGAVVLWPFDNFYRHERLQFLRIFKRICIGGIDLDRKFGDIMLADIITSYAKVLGDFWVLGCMLFDGIETTGKPDRSCGGTYFVPFVLSIPYLIRFRQCATEYKNSSQRTDKFKHVMNAIKYSTAFPVIFLSALHRTFVSELEENNPDRLWFGESMIFKFWILSVVVNSLYSFWWDVVMDWRLSMFTGNAEVFKDGRHWGLRKTLCFREPIFYYCAIFVDFVLRMTWAIKLSTHLHHLNELEGGIFTLETLEVGSASVKLQYTNFEGYA